MLNYALRVNLTIAIVEMVAPTELIKPTELITNGDSILHNTTMATDHITTMMPIDNTTTTMANTTVELFSLNTHLLLKNKKQIYF